MAHRSIVKGTQTIEALARRFPQLYVAPAEGAEAAHRLAAGRGQAPGGATLDHFVRSDADELLEVQTTAGPVEVLFLERREDFSTFLQIIGKRSSPEPIPPTIGAMTYRGIADWQAVEKARIEYIASGGTQWPKEFARLARIPGTFRTELVVVSQGPYSNIPATQTPYQEDEWLRISRDIRLNHECAHVVCRRVMPQDILPIWDEVTADMVGLLCACGTYDADLASRFLGVTSEGFAGGRLAEYLDDGQRGDIDRLSRKVHEAVLSIAHMLQDGSAATDPFELLLDLKRKPLLEM